MKKKEENSGGGRLKWNRRGWYRLSFIYCNLHTVTL